MIEKFKSCIKRSKGLKEFVLLLICPKRNPKPRLWVKWFINPFVHKRGKGSIIRSLRSRIDVFPWHRFDIGDYTTIEDFTTINNGSGDIILGNNVRIGIGSVVLGPIELENGVILAQHVFIAGFNHGFKDGTKSSVSQEVERRSTKIGEDTIVGANSSVLAGVHIGKRCQIGAGSVVTKSIPSYSVAVGNPAKVIKQFDFEKKDWVKV